MGGFTSLKLEPPFPFEEGGERDGRERQGWDGGLHARDLDAPLLAESSYALQNVPSAGWRDRAVIFPRAEGRVLWPQENGRPLPLPTPRLAAGARLAEGRLLL
eukprot:5835039-Pyramimonas_sp.AAC.1